MTELLTTRAVAELLAVSPETILRWHRSGKLPGGRRLGSNVLRFERDELETWLDASRTDRPLVSVGEGSYAFGALEGREQEAAEAANPHEQRWSVPGSNR